MARLELAGYLSQRGSDQLGDPAVAMLQRGNS